MHVRALEDLVEGARSAWGRGEVGAARMKQIERGRREGVGERERRGREEREEDR